MDKEMRAEWEAWIATSRELKSLGFDAGWDTDQVEGLHLAVCRWGENLVALRVGQSEEIRSKALSEIEKRYARWLAKK